MCRFTRTTKQTRIQADVFSCGRKTRFRYRPTDIHTDMQKKHDGNMHALRQTDRHTDRQTDGQDMLTMLRCDLACANIQTDTGTNADKTYIQDMLIIATTRSRLLELSDRH